MKSSFLARGFHFAGVHCGVKVARPDLALITTDRPAEVAGVFTTNEVRAACVERGERMLPSGSIRALVVTSGIANAMTGPEGAARDERMAVALADALDLLPNEVLTGSTGSIGDPLPIETIEAGIPALVEALGDDVHRAAEAIMTTDRVVKRSSAAVSIGDEVVYITAIAKGSGMIHPNMATMLAYVCTDAVCSAEDLQTVLKEATDASFNQISVDRDTSTNDTVLLLANGASGVSVGPDTAAFVEAIGDVCRDLARQIAADGEGATRLISLQVTGAGTLEAARSLSRAAISSNLFKCSVYGDMSGSGRCMAAVGAHAGALGIALDEGALSVQVNGVLEVSGGVPTGELAAMTGPEVVYTVDLGQGDASAWAWGCDFSYGYVSVNAVTKSEPLETHSPGLKRRLLVEALTYIRRFAGRLAVIKYGGAAMVRDDLKDAFAEDLTLLKAAGLLPVVIHGGGPEISRTLDLLGKETHFIDGIRVTDPGSMKIVEMVLTGSVNTDIVTRIHANGGRAIGLSGKDGALLSARKLRVEGRDYGQVGVVDEVRCEVLTTLLAEDYIPVISPVGVDAHGETFNINADEVSAQVAIALGATKLLYLTDVPGILHDDELVSEATPEQIAEFITDGVVQGGMIPKVRSMLSALEGGVTSGHIIDGRVPHNLLAELFTDRGVGTWVKKSG